MISLLVKVTEENAKEIFKSYPVVCEAFDDPQYKAILVNALLEENGKKIVAASGMAGYDSANKITTKKTFANLYVCGDLQPAMAGGIGLMAPRVMICAGHQANMVVRLLLNIEQE